MRSLWRRTIREPPAPRGQPPAGENGEPDIVDVVGAVARYAVSHWTRVDWVRYILLGRRREPLPSYTGVVEAPAGGKIGIACSGGGIRSASYNLGALQVLQREGVLARARYLAAVSGGSYIAAAFYMVRSTWEGGTQPRRPRPGWDDSDPSLVTAEHPPFFPGSPEEQYLRNRSTYMAPGLVGELRLGYRLVLGLGINLGFIALFLVVVGLGLGLLYAGIYPSLARHVNHGRCGRSPCAFAPLVVDAGVWVPIVAVAGAALFLGGAAMVAYLWPGHFREAADTWSQRLLLLAGLGALVVIVLPILVSLLRDWGTAHAASAVRPATTTLAATLQTVGIGVVGAAAAGSGVILQLRADWSALQRLVRQGQQAVKWYSRLSVRVQRFIAYAIAAAIGPALALGLMLVVASTTLNLAHPAVRWAAFGTAAAVFALIYTFADLNTWSLHTFYRRRLCSAFALKRVRGSDHAPIARELAGVALEREYNERVPLARTANQPGTGGTRAWPTLLVCAAANVSDTAATPPGREVTSFTFSAGAIGGPLIGAVRTDELETACDPRRESYFTLPAAVAMSGAAVSPSMGKLTRRPLRVLLALTNIRLGVWVPNPRRLEKFQGREDIYPRPRPLYLLWEMLGINRVDAPYLYVTDGGHYENLGLVELLRRGCTEIYCFDASGGPALDALGDAISLARSELQVEVKIDTTNVVPGGDGFAKSDFVKGTFTFPQPGAPAGTLFYARTVLTADLPADVLAYRARDARFPNDPTTDQLYPDQRFEAYRALGAHAAENVISAARRRRWPPSLLGTP